MPHTLASYFYCLARFSVLPLIHPAAWAISPFYWRYQHLMVDDPIPLQKRLFGGILYPTLSPIFIFLITPTYHLAYNPFTLIFNTPETKPWFSREFPHSIGTMGCLLFGWWDICIPFSDSSPVVGIAWIHLLDQHVLSRIAFCDFRFRPVLRMRKP